MLPILMHQDYEGTYWYNEGKGEFEVVLIGLEPFLLGTCKHEEDVKEVFTEAVQEHIKFHGSFGFSQYDNPLCVPLSRSTVRMLAIAAINSKQPVEQVVEEAVKLFFASEGSNLLL